MRQSVVAIAGLVEQIGKFEVMRNVIRTVDARGDQFRLCAAGLIVGEQESDQLEPDGATPFALVRPPRRVQRVSKEPKRFGHILPRRGYACQFEIDLGILWLGGTNRQKNSARRFVVTLLGQRSRQRQQIRTVRAVSDHRATERVYRLVESPRFRELFAALVPLVGVAHAEVAVVRGDRLGDEERPHRDKDQDGELNHLAVNQCGAVG